VNDTAHIVTETPPRTGERGGCSTAPICSTITVSWFSAGVSSAIATWLEIARVQRIIYTHIADQHEDTLRFVRDCEQWWQRPVEIIQAEQKTVEEACMYRQFVNGPGGASCTRMLKRELRKQWEAHTQFFNTFRYVWGFDKDETNRTADILDAMPEHEHVFPLVDRGISKEEAHAILKAQGIRRPVMYDLGYPNNNCVGCVKGGAGYWNKIRRDFPEVFAKRAAMERTIGGTCINGTYLDELDPEAGRDVGPVVPECGAMCEILSNDQAQRRPD
jgi:hypothetical protein